MCDMSIPCLHSSSPFLKCSSERCSSIFRICSSVSVLTGSDLNLQSLQSILMRPFALVVPLFFSKKIALRNKYWFGANYLWIIPETNNLEYTICDFPERSSNSGWDFLFNILLAWHDLVATPENTVKYVYITTRHSNHKWKGALHEPAQQCNF